MTQSTFMAFWVERGSYPRDPGDPDSIYLPCWRIRFRIRGLDQHHTAPQYFSTREKAVAYVNREIEHYPASASWRTP